jgi:hypothetical protein
MLWLRFAYSLLFASVSLSCARPSVEDDAFGDVDVSSVDDAGPSDDDGQDGDDEPPPERDAGTVVKDAGGPLPPKPDAGNAPPTTCPDRDNDEVCDSDDNCVAEPNTAQADSDGNGIGDVCDIPVPKTCNGTPIPDVVDLGLARVRTVRVNGNDGTPSVKPGALVMVSAELTLSVGSCWAPQRAVSVGFDAGDLKCEETVLCNMFQPVAETVAFDLVAPNEPGLHYVGMSIGQPPIGQSTSRGCGSEAPLQVDIAALCVEP